MSTLPSEALDRVLNGLRAHGLTPKRSGSGWSCRCPAHEDRSPSLSIGAGVDGRALITCHAGCTTDSVVAAIGLTMRDLMPASAGPMFARHPDRAQATGPAPTITRAPASNAEPARAPSPDALIATFERKIGPACDRWTYHDSRGGPVGVIVRWDRPPAPGARPGAKPSKTILPFSLIDGQWVNRAMPAPRPLWNLPELLALPADTWVYVCEGEKAAHAARAIGFMATCSAGGSGAPTQTDWSPLRDKFVVVLPDNDEPGEEYADAVTALCRAAGAKQVRVLRLCEHWPQLPEAGDIVDVLELDGGDAESVHERIDGLAEAAEPEPSEKRGGSSIPPYRPFPVDALPDPLRAFVAEGAAAIGCDASFIALPLFSALAGAVGNTRRIQLKRGWSEPAVIWTAIIGESGTQKSPAFRYSLRPAHARQHRQMKEHRDAVERWEGEMKLHEIALAKWKKEATNTKRRRTEADAGVEADRHLGAAEQLVPESCPSLPRAAETLAAQHPVAQPPASPERPICPRTWIEDCTTEALATLLQENPRGLLTCRSELSGWFSFGQYKNGGGADDVARWLQMFDADPLIVDRKTSGTTYVPNAAVALAGGVQPAILHRALGEQHRQNGLLARLLLAYPPRRAKRWSEAEVDSFTENAVTLLFDRLYELEADRTAEGDPAPRHLRLDARAKQVWVDFVNEHGEEQLALVGDEAAAWSKLEGYAARLALIVHLVRAAAEEAALADAEVVDAASIASGVRLSRWFAVEARRVYAMLAADEAEQEEQRLVDLLARQGKPVTARDWQRIRSLDTVREARAELDRMAAAGIGEWHRAPPGPKGGQPTARFALTGWAATSDGTTPTAQHGGPVAAGAAHIAPTSANGATEATDSADSVEVPSVPSVSDAGATASANATSPSAAAAIPVGTT
ncbi:MAG: DUF3987 domain-containing protein [Phycisphaeraceae bacterium]|nr:DUF3987 domain-containing protein [Phycisphaeraceae bacterium]